MSDELKPCPFCGGEASMQRFNASTMPARIICQCGVELRAGKGQSVEGIVEQWNTRAERACRWVPFGEGHSIAGPGWRCSECGLELGPENVFVAEQCYCCPGCGSKVVG